MICTFGYMVLLIVIKWLTDFSGRENESPSITTIFINFVNKIQNPLMGVDN